MSRPVVFACSPRKGGNTDDAARYFSEGVRVAGGSVRTVVIRDAAVAPCIGCHACAPDKGGRCVLPDAEAVDELYRIMLDAPFVFFAAPIYFYHLPANFKALIDRSQPWFLRWAAGDRALRDLPERPAYAALIAGRPQGEKLFAGSRLTLKYYLMPFGFNLQTPLEFLGKDAPGELDDDAEVRRKLIQLGQQAWEKAR